MFPKNRFLAGGAACALIIIITGSLAGCGGPRGSTQELVPGDASSAPPIAHCSVLQTCKVQLAWDPHPEQPNVKFRIYYGKVSRFGENGAEGSYEHMLDVGASLDNTAIVPNLGEGTWYFAATAYNEAGMESLYSNEVNVGFWPADGRRAASAEIYTIGL